MSLQTVAVTGGTRVTVHPHAGVRLNALLPPALEDGRGDAIVLREGARSADTAYFAAAAFGVVPDGRTRPARLRVSWCTDREALCRSTVFDLVRGGPA